MIPGAGGNTAAFVTANGVVLVDTKLANNGQAILDQVKTISDKPITHIINTHTHGDHNGSNQFFPASVEIVVQENTQKNMQKMPVFQEEANKHGLPDRAYKDRLTLLRGDESIDLFYFGKAHTDGDTFVLFRNARVLHTGDAFANRGQPNIDLPNGGSGVAYPDTLAKAASTIKNVDTIIAGHNAALLKHEDLVNQAEFTRLMLTQGARSGEGGEDSRAGDDGVPDDAAGEVQGLQPRPRPWRSRRCVRAALRRAEAVEVERGFSLRDQHGYRASSHGRLTSSVSPPSRSIRLISPLRASRRDGYITSRTASPFLSVAFDQPRDDAHCSGGPSPFHSSTPPPDV